MANLPTRLADVIVPEVFRDYVIERTAELSELVRSGIIVRTDEFDALVRQGGELIQMPFWKDLTGDDEIVTTNQTTSVGKITTGKDQAQRLLRKKAWGAEDIAGILAGSDPMKAIGDLVAAYWVRRFQVTVLAMLKGVFAAASMSSAVSALASGGVANDSTTLNGMTFVDVTGLLGDAAGKLTGVAMHSATERALRKLDMIDYVPDSQGRPLKSFQGHAMIVDDTMPTRSVDGRTAYTTYLFGPGAIAHGENTNPKPVDGGIGDWYQELARNANTGVSEMYNRRDFILHPRGVKFTQGSMALETPSNDELATGTNWERVYEQKNVRMVAVEHYNA
mgnify:CR=1 FL=1